MSFREMFSNTIESGTRGDFPTRLYATSQQVMRREITQILSPERGFTLIHHSDEYHEYMFSHRLGEVTLTIIQSSAVESAVGMYVMTKKRFGFPKKWGNTLYALIDKQFTRK